MFVNVLPDVVSVSASNAGVEFLEAVLSVTHFSSKLTETLKLYCPTNYTLPFL